MKYLCTIVKRNIYCDSYDIEIIVFYLTTCQSIFNLVVYLFRITISIIRHNKKFGVERKYVVDMKVGSKG